MRNFLVRVRRFVLQNSLLFLLLFLAALQGRALAQSTGGLRGQVFDPSNAVVPGATVTLAQGPTVLTAQSGEDGAYVFKGVPAGSYTLSADVTGFASFRKTGVVITSGQAHTLNISLAIAVAAARHYGE